MSKEKEPIVVNQMAAIQDVPKLFHLANRMIQTGQTLMNGGMIVGASAKNQQIPFTGKREPGQSYTPALLIVSIRQLLEEVKTVFDVKPEQELEAALELKKFQETQLMTEKQNAGPTN